MVTGLNNGSRLIVIQDDISHFVFLAKDLNLLNPLITS